MKNNHNYNEPEPGMTDWHVPINENFEQIDRDVEIRDVESNLSEYTVKKGAKYFATDTENVYIADGDGWNRVLSRGKTPQFKSVNGDQYVSMCEGATLCERLQNAIDTLGDGQGTIRITAKSDLTPWQWDQDLSIDLIELEGLEILVGNDVVIEYTGSGTMLTVDNTDSVRGGHPGSGSHLVLRGGVWRSTNEDPQCWIRIKDSIGGRISPNEVEDFNNIDGNATAVCVENHASYSENYHISGKFDRVDRGVDYIPQSETGGAGGTDSFHDSYLENLHVNAFDFCVRLRGKWDYGTIVNPSFFAKADGSTCLVLGTQRADGTTISGMKCESPGDSENTIAIEDNGDFDDFYAPTIVGGRLDGYGIDTVYHTEKRVPFLGQVWMRGEGIRLTNWGTGKTVKTDRSGGLRIDGNLNVSGGSFTHDGSEINANNDGSNLFFRVGGNTAIEIDNQNGGYINAKRPVGFPEEDVSSLGSVNENRVYVHHDGSDGNPEGLYYSDTNSTQWVELAGSATIPF